MSEFRILSYFPGKRKCLSNSSRQVTMASQCPSLTIGMVSCRARVDTCSSRGVGVSSSLALAGRRRPSRGAACTVLRVEPDGEGEHPLRELFEEEGYRGSGRGIQPATTLVVSLEGDEQEILGQMKPKTRYNVRLAERKGVTVRHGDEADVSVFYGLMEETRDREAFGVHEEEYYLEAWRIFAPG